jgi:hypothetical protein
MKTGCDVPNNASKLHFAFGVRQRCKKNKLCGYKAVSVLTEEGQE